MDVKQKAAKWLAHFALAMTLVVSAATTGNAEAVKAKVGKVLIEKAGKAAKQRGQLKPFDGEVKNFLPEQQADEGKRMRKSRGEDEKPAENRRWQNIKDHAKFGGKHFLQGQAAYCAFLSDEKCAEFRKKETLRQEKTADNIRRKIKNKSITPAGEHGARKVITREGGVIPSKRVKQWK